VSVIAAPPGRRRVTVADVRRALGAVAALEPDRVDPRAVEGQPARYVDAERPNCLVARVLFRLGFPLGVLSALDAEHPPGDLFHVGVRVADSRHRALRRLDPAARALLQYVQDRQGQRWGTIMRGALRPGLFSLVLRRRPW
jgi:hypothetical protein